MLRDDLKADWLAPGTEGWTSSSAMVARGDELDSKEEATDGEAEEADEVDGDEGEVAQDEDAECWQASLVLLL